MGSILTEVTGLAAGELPVKIFMKDGGWCWYQDPRAIVVNDKLFIGSVPGHGSGPALVGVYDLRADKILGSVTLRDNFDRDDHNSPVFYARDDGSVLAVYARHGRENCFYTRVSDPENPLQWGDEARVELPEKVTYANLFELSDEGKLYNFFRCIDWNPTFVTSTDGGNAWHQPVHFIVSELNGRHRPYARYAGNGKDTIHISFTDGHPRNFGNSIYYAAFRAGKFRRADGRLIKDLEKDGALLPSEAELIYQGSGKPGTGHNLSAPNSAWTSSIAYDQQGYPHIGYSVYLNNEDHRYRIASWDGKKWQDREVAFAGTCLYDRESSYTGLIALDPADPAYVVISTDVNPRTGEKMKTHEIFRANIALNETVETIHWKQLTHGSQVMNIRPMILNDGTRRIVLWNRGIFKTYTDYRLNTVGFIEPVQKNVDK